MRHSLNKLTMSIVMISLSPFAFIHTSTAATVTGNTVTYEGEILGAPIVEGGTATNNLEIKNTQVTATDSQLSSILWPSVVSIGGNNGNLGNNGELYGNLTISVDDQSTISTQGANSSTSIYVRSDTPNATVTVNNAGALSINSTDTSIYSVNHGILAENFGGDYVTGDGSTNVNLQSGSNIAIATGAVSRGVTADGREVNVTTDQNSQIKLTNDTTSDNAMTGLYLNARKDAFLENKGSITINSAQSAGVKIGANITSRQKATVINEGTIGITGNNSTAINVTANTSDVTSNGEINVTGANANGIIVNSTGTDVTDTQTLNVSGNITIDGNGSAVGSAVALNNQTKGAGILTYDDVNGIVSVTGNSTTQGSYGPTGFFQTNTVGSDVQINIENIHTIKIDSNEAIGIGARSSGGTGNTVINFKNGLIQSTGNNADGINVSNRNNGGDITINQAGDISASGGLQSQTEGIYGDKSGTTGNVYINSLGNIDIDAQQGIGILTNVKNGSSIITFDNADKHINTKSTGLETTGILARAGDANNSVTINIANADYISAVNQHDKATAISTSATTGANSSITLGNINTVTAQSASDTAQAISAQVTGTGTSSVNISDNVGLVEAIGNGQAISAITQTGTNTITLGNTKIEGGTGSNGGGIYMESTTGNQLLTSSADISADNDQALFGTSGAATTIENNNTVTGYTNFAGVGAVTFNNNGDIVLQNFNGTTSKSSIDNNYGLNGIFNNKGTIRFSEKNNTGSITTVSFNNVANFDHSGIINLTTNDTQSIPSFVGNTLQITNGGNGNFVSNGGSLIVNTHFNGSTGTSDRLIVDNATTGTAGATKVYINPTANSIYGNLAGNGIEVITVNGTSSSNAFALGRPVMNGVYQYGLYQGNAAGGAASQSWFLRNESNTYNPVVGGYLANQTAATEMFNQQLRDRLLVMPASQDTSQLNTLWMRTKMAHGSYRSLGDNINNKNRLYMAQMGSDIGVWKLNDGNLHVGLMAGYGDYKNTSTSEDTHTKADSKVKGYNAGVYATWFQNDDANKGLYVDTWSQYGWYRNETSGKDVSGSKKYDSNTWSTSIETGYGLVLGTKDNLQWTATPQAQLTYNYYHADNLYDRANVLNVTNSKGSGLVTRLGLRIQAKDIQLAHSIEPFAEFNWINNSAKNDIDFNGMKLSNGVPHNRYETKVGLLGNITPKLSVSAQVGGTWGDNRYKEYTGQLNLNYKF